MLVARFVVACLLWALSVSATILQNGQVREDPYPGQVSTITLDDSWRNYDADASEIAYKGRWDRQHISWWSAPGIKLELTGKQLAVSFGQKTTNGVLVAYRIGSLDWQFSNLTADATYQFVGSDSELDETVANVFEMRVTNWGYGVQIAGVSVAKDAQLVPPAVHKKKVEIIGGSLASGQFASYEGLSSYAFLFAEGLGNVEHTITAYPGVCLADMQCYGGGVHGMTWFWHRASDPGVRASQEYGGEPEEYDISAQQPADLVIIQMGGNDHRAPNEIPGRNFYHAYVELIDDIHKTWPKAVILIMSQWGEFTKQGSRYVPSTLYEDEAKAVHDHFKDQGFVYYFNTQGVLQHNDINPKNHPTDVGHIKVASHLLQWVKLVLRWNLEPSGEVQHGTLYWNDQQEY